MSGQDSIDDVLALHAELGRAAAAHDVDAVERLYAPEFTLNAPSNRIQSRQETIDAIANPALRQVDVNRTIEAIYESGDVVVMMGHESLVWEGTGTAADGQRTARRFTNVWRRMEGTWRQVARQATTVPLPPDNP